MDNFEYPYIEVEGDPHDIGLQVGEKAKAQINNSIGVYTKTLQKELGVNWKDIAKYAEKYIECIMEYDNEIVEEMRGIAEGSGNNFSDIVALNARTELLGKSKDMLDGCTAFGVNNEASQNNENYIGQNWDFYTRLKDSMIVLKIKQKNKPNILMLAEGGLVGKIGFNSNGIGVCLNMLQTQNNCMGVPTHIILRGILNSQNIVDAIGAITRFGLASAANYLIGNDTGTLLDVEADPTDFDVLFDKNGIITHTNHIVSVKLLDLKEKGRYEHPDTYVRKMRIDKSLNKATGKVTIDDIKIALRDHEGYPDSICRHDNPNDPEHTRASTVASLIMNLSKKEMLVTSGNPCKSNYKKYKL